MLNVNCLSLLPSSSNSSSFLPFSFFLYFFLCLFFFFNTRTRVSQTFFHPQTSRFHALRTTRPTRLWWRPSIFATSRTQVQRACDRANKIKNGKRKRGERGLRRGVKGKNALRGGGREGNKGRKAKATVLKIFQLPRRFAESLIKSFSCRWLRRSTTPLVTVFLPCFLQGFTIHLLVFFLHLPAGRLTSGNNEKLSAPSRAAKWFERNTFFAFPSPSLPPFASFSF